MAPFTDQIRKALGDSDGLNLDELMEARPEGANRNNVSTICAQRKRAGEFAAAVEDGKVTYRLVPDYKPDYRHTGAKAAQRQAAPSLATKGAEERAHRDATRKTSTFKAAGESQAKVRAALEFNHATACDAVEVYVASVANRLPRARRCARPSTPRADDFIAADGT